MVGEKSLLCLYLQGEEVPVGIFEVAHTSKGHLLFQIVPEPLTTNRVAIHERNLRSEEQSAIEHGLQGEPLAEGDGGAPVGVDVADARLLLHLGKIVSQVGIFHLET